ncbi:MAG: YIP1 family protein [Phycisphaeraceae bacterium]|nr:YIP1 family protein [Phycisphaeraceae bacterium]
MRCPQCDYRLWNLTTRACPECGRPFKPTDFEFLPHTVAFCCPHCDQPYYGQSDKGHLIPPEFDCVRCGRRLHMDQMVLRPAPGLEEEQTSTPINPWFMPGKTSFFRRYFAALWQSIAHPGRAAEGVPADARWWRSALFLSLNFCLFLAVGMLFFVLAMTALLTMAPPPRGRGMSGVMVIFLVPAATVLAGAVGSQIVALLWGGSIHGMLHLLRCRPRHPFKRTYDALALTSGVHVLTAVPCCGLYLSVPTTLAWIVTTTIALLRVQRTPALRTTLATLALPLAVAAVLVSAGLWINSLATGSQRSSNTRTVAHELQTYASSHQGRGPAHAIEMIQTGNLSPFSLTTLGSRPTIAAVPVASATLLDFTSLSPAEQQLQAAAATAYLPADVIAHRLGDYVFVHHGLDFATAPHDAWAVIWSPNPDHAKRPSRRYYVGRIDGSVEEFNDQTFPQELQQQNQLRAALGLAPLPDPQTITHALPASASNAPPNYAATQPQAP